MALSPVETILLSTGASAIVSVVVSIITTEYRLRRKQTVSEQQENEDWQRQAVQFGREVRRKWQRDYEEHRKHFTSFDEMKREMKILANQLDTHANEGEDRDVDDEVVEKLRACASACRTLSQVRVSSNRTPWEEAGEAVKDTAEDLEEIASNEK